MLLSKDRFVLLSSCFTRRTARGARSLDHQRVICTRPRLRIIEAEMQGFSTGYLRVLSGTIEYDRELREVGCELRRSNNSGRSLDMRRPHSPPPNTPACPPQSGAYDLSRGTRPSVEPHGPASAWHRAPAALGFGHSDTRCATPILRRVGAFWCFFLYN